MELAKLGSFEFRRVDGMGKGILDAGRRRPRACLAMVVFPFP